MTEREKPVSSKEVAEYLGVARSTIEEWRQKGKGPPFMRIGNRCLYMMTDVQEWLLAQRESPETGELPGEPPLRHSGPPMHQPAGKKPWNWAGE